MRRYLLDTNMMGDFIDQRWRIEVRVDEVRRRGDRMGNTTVVSADRDFDVVPGLAVENWLTP